MVDVVSKLVEFECGLLDEGDTVELFQELVNSGIAWKLQGSYGRIARDLIGEGLITG